MTAQEAAVIEALQAAREDHDAAMGYDAKPMVAVAWQEAAALGERLSADGVTYRLPTEAEWEAAARGGLARARYPWGDEPPREELGNFDMVNWNPAPVHAHPNGVSAFGVADLLGNGWEWTSTPFAPLPGFAAFPFYPGYSVDFFDGKHFVMKGGSPRTPATLLRRSFRNWFQPHYQYIYSKFRCVSE